MYGLIISGFISLMAAGQVIAPPGSLEGRLTNAQTGDAVAGATIRLNPTNVGSVLPQTTSSQADGGFRFEAIPPGTYLLMAEKSGFVTAVPGVSPPIVVSSGQLVSKIALQLSPAGTISGKITDEKRDAVPRAMVELFTVQTHGGRLQLRSGPRTTSDSNGDYKLKNVAPGKYYVAADPQHPTAPEEQPTASGSIDEQSDFDLVRTFYPQSLNFETAAVVDISPGQDVSETNISLRRTATFHVRGQIAAFDNTGAAEGWSLSLAPRGTLASDALGRIVRARKDGTFDIDKVLPGSYTLALTGMARVNQGETNMVQYRSRLLSRQELELGASDLNGIVVSVIPSIDLTGRVTTEGPGSADLSRVRVNFAPAGEILLGTFQSMPVKSDGTFTVSNLDPGQYVIHVVGAAAGVYVRSATFNRQDITTAGMDVTQGGSGDVEIVLKFGSGDVSGKVQASETETSSTVRRANVLVVLAPATPPPDGSGILFGSALPGGNFSIRGVPPGQYYAFALERWSAIWQNPDFLHEMQSSGTRVEVPENGHMQIQLSTTTMVQVQEITARLGLTPQ
jgi:hypothetical protein